MGTAFYFDGNYYTVRQCNHGISSVTSISQVLSYVITKGIGLKTVQLHMLLFYKRYVDKIFVLLKSENQVNTY